MLPSKINYKYRKECIHYVLLYINNQRTKYRVLYHIASNSVTDIAIARSFGVSELCCSINLSITLPWIIISIQVSHICKIRLSLVQAHVHSQLTNKHTINFTRKHNSALQDALQSCRDCNSLLCHEVSS